MNFLTLSQIKAQIRMEPDFTLEDNLLTTYGESAEDTVLNVCSTTYEQVIEEYGKVPMPLIQAALMLVDLSYQQRSPISQQNLYQVPYAFDFLVKPYMKLTTNYGNNNENNNNNGRHYCNL